MTLLWDSIGPIDRDIRKFGSRITEAYTFDTFLHNTRLQEVFKNHPINSINWSLTQAWTSHNETSDVCSTNKSNKDVVKIRSRVLTYRKDTIMKWELDCILICNKS